MPRKSRFTVTLGIGAVATIAGMFPAVAMKLLNFVALWGMILMPMGAIIFIDFWVIKRFGLRSNYAEYFQKKFNFAAGLAWIVTVSICTWLVLTGRIQIFFVSLPGWFLTAIHYIVISFLYQKKMRPQIRDKE